MFHGAASLVVVLHPSSGKASTFENFTRLGSDIKFNQSKFWLPKLWQPYMCFKPNTRGNLKYKPEKDYEAGLLDHNNAFI